ncbi:lycopene cyclase [bacterium]|nr:lycopene cyclase [bacterium]
MSQVYDYIIIGAGAAGLHLLHAMLDEPALASKKILIIDKDSKSENDRTWSFWELGAGHWDTIVSKHWKQSIYRSKEKNLKQDLSPYSYKTIHASDWYALGKERANNSDQVDWVQDEVKNVGERERMEIECNLSSYQAQMVFDSRVPKEAEWQKSVGVLQYFAGWFIKTEQPIFNPEEFVMMDYQMKLEETCSFMYVLPFSEREALFEFTFFSPELVSDEVYEDKIKEYIDRQYPGLEYEVERTERGNIPMTVYPFEKHNTLNHIRIGTGGGWVKASTGYSFKNSERLARKTVQRLKENKNPGLSLFSKKYRLYDDLFLRVLEQKNELGEELFDRMYGKHPIQRVFRFLDEESSLVDDLAIIWSYRGTALIGALWQKLTGK